MRSSSSRARAPWDETAPEHASHRSTTSELTFLGVRKPLPVEEELTAGLAQPRKAEVPGPDQRQLAYQGRFQALVLGNGFFY